MTNMYPERRWGWAMGSGLWAVVILGLFYLFGYNYPLLPYGVTDEEVQFFFSSMLVSEGSPPFFFRQPAFFIANLGGAIGWLTGISISEPQLYLNVARGISSLVLLLSIAHFYFSFSKRYGNLICFSAICMFLAWPSVLHWANHFCASSFLAPVSLLLFTTLWKNTFEPNWSLRHASVLGILMGALVSIKISSIYAVGFIGLGIFLSAGIRQGFVRATLFSAILILGALSAWFVFSIPYLEYSLHPFWATIRGIAVGSQFLKGGGLWMYFGHHLPVLFPIVLLVGVAITCSFMHLGRRLLPAFPISQRGRLESEITNQAIVILAPLPGLLLSFVGSGAEDQIVAGARWALPLAPLPAFCVLFLFGKGKKQSKRVQVGCVSLSFSILVALWVFVYQPSHIRIKSDTIKKNSEVTALVAQDIDNGASVGLWRSALSPFSDYWLTGNYQYAGGKFIEELAVLFPQERLFVFYAADGLKEARDVQLNDYIARYQDIACLGQTGRIQTRQNSLIVKVAGLLSRVIPADECEKFIDFLLRSNFETRYEIPNGDDAIRYRQALLAEPGFVPEYLIIPSKVGAKDSNIPLTLEAIADSFPIAEWRPRKLASDSDIVYWVGVTRLE